MQPFDQAFDEIATQMVDIIGQGITKEQARSLLAEPMDPNATADVTLPVNRARRFKLKLDGTPSEVSQAWASKFVPTETVVSASGSEEGFVSFVISPVKLYEGVISFVAESGSKYGEDHSVGAGKKCVFEYCSANLGKPFHQGHLRSTIMGQFLVNTHKALGYDVTAINYMGDWGSQYSLLSLGFEKYGSDEKLEADPMGHLYEIYVKINADAAEDASVKEAARAHFVRMEAGEEDALKHWRRFRELSIRNMETVFRRLNVHFDVYDGESMQADGMKSAITTCQEKGIVHEDAGAQLITFPGKEGKKLGKVLLVKSDGSTLYFTRDLAAARARHEKYNFDQMCYVVGSQQDLHFKQVFKTLEMMGHDWAKKCEHVQFGMVKGMSTRKGTAVFLKDILDESKQRTLELMKENAAKFSDLEDPDATADKIGVAAVVVQDLYAKRIKGYEFNWDRIFDIGGKTGPYLQYAHARLCSIERKCGVALNLKADTSVLASSDERESDVARKLTKTIAKFPAKVLDAVEKREPNTIVIYMFDLSKAVNSANDPLKVKGMPQEIAEARLLLFHCARVTLGNAMRLLGLHPVERM